MNKLLSVNCIVLLFLLFSNMAQADEKFGPYGGVGGTNFDDPLSGNERICGIYVRHGSRVDAIQIEACDNAGNRYLRTRHGGSGGTSSYFNLGNSVLRLVEVWVNKRSGSLRVFGLRFRTSNGVNSPVFGTASGYRATIVANGGEISGLFGSAGSELDSLGVYNRQLNLSIKGMESNGPDNVAGAGGVGGQKFIPSPTYSPAPPGAPAVTSAHICGFKVRHAARIDAIQVKYCANNGQVGYDAQRGGNGGSLSVFTMNQTGEYLKSIKGWRGRRNGSDRIFGLQFETNRRISPVYGTMTSDSFEFTSHSQAKIQGVCGRSANELDAIYVCRSREL